MSATASAKYTLLAPAIYLTVVIAGLIIFTRIWQKPKKGITSSDAPWFGRHIERDIYYTLLAQTNPPADDVVLKAALLRRAIEDVKRIWRMREVKPALTQMVSRGLVGDDLLAQFTVTEKELEAEIFEVVNEAQTFRDGWGPVIFATASEMAQHEKQKGIVREIAALRELNTAKNQIKMSKKESNEKAEKDKKVSNTNLEAAAIDLAETPSKNSEPALEAESTTKDDLVNAEQPLLPTDSTSSSPQAKGIEEKNANPGPTPSKNKKKKGKK